MLLVIGWTVLLTALLERRVSVEGRTSVSDIAAFTVFFLFVGVLFAAIAGASVFCASFTMLNPLLQAEQLDSTFFENELRTGVLGLRIASLVVCYRSLGYIGQYILERLYTSERLFDRPSKRYPELDQLGPTYLDDTDLDMVCLSQWGLYAVVLTNLWVLTILPLPREPILVALLSWALFFIFDDWIIISEYARSLKGWIFPSHAARVHLFNLVLTVPLLVLIFQAFSWAGAAISGLFIFIFLFWRYVFPWVQMQRFSG